VHRVPARGRGFAADHELLRSLRDKPIEPTARPLGQDGGRARTSPRPGESAPAGRPPFWRAVPRRAAAGVMVHARRDRHRLPAARCPPDRAPRRASAVITLTAGDDRRSRSRRPDQGAPPIRERWLRLRVHGRRGGLPALAARMRAAAGRARDGSTLNLAGVPCLDRHPLAEQQPARVTSRRAGFGEGKILSCHSSLRRQPSPHRPRAGASPSQEAILRRSRACSAGPTPEPTPTGQIEILSGVTIVGDVAYSPDEHWLAFSAAPKDGSTGPDLYLYGLGGPAAGGERRITRRTSRRGSATGSSPVTSLRRGRAGGAGQPERLEGPDASGNGQQRPGQRRPGPGERGSRLVVLFDPVTSTRTELVQRTSGCRSSEWRIPVVTYWRARSARPTA
jgi:hypothetical protein